MKVAVTGSQGFIGTHVAGILGGREHDVAEIDRTQFGLDLTSTTDARRISDQLFGAGAIIHCAAHADVRQNWFDEGLRGVERDNVIATLRLLGLARWTLGRGLPFVFVSTGAVYAGCADYVAEGSIIRATSPYAASKLAGEAYVQAYAEKFGWRWYVVRPAACFGSGYHHGHVRDFVTQVHNTGRVHALDSGQVQRPAMHVEDLADALVELATGDHPSGIYNAAGGVWSWRNTIELMGLAPDKVTCEDRESGWVGDSKGATWDGTKLARIIAPKRKIADGVRDALTSCGWST